MQLCRVWFSQTITRYGMKIYFCLKVKEDLYFKPIELLFECLTLLFLRQKNKLTFKCFYNVYHRMCPKSLLVSNFIYLFNFFFFLYYSVFITFPFAEITSGHLTMYEKNLKSTLLKKVGYFCVKLSTQLFVLHE